RGLVLQFFHLLRPLRHLPRGPVRSPCASRQGYRQGAARPSCKTLRCERLGATAVVGARLERAVDRLLQIARCRADGRMDCVPRQRSGARSASESQILMEIVLIAAVADNGVIGANGAIPWRLKSDMQRFKAMTMGRPVVMGRKTFQSLRRPLP